MAVAEILIILDFLPAEDVGFSSTLEGSFDAPLSDTDDSELELLDSSSFSLDAEAAEGFTSASGFLSPFSSSSSSGLDCTELSVVLGVDADGDESDFSPLSFFFEPAVSITSAADFSLSFSLSFSELDSVDGELAELTVDLESDTDPDPDLLSPENDASPEGGRVSKT